MKLPKPYVSKPVGVLAIQWTGDNLTAIQAFVAPSSPYFQPARAAKPGSASDVMDEHRKAVLSVMVADHAANTQWPAIAPHFKMQVVPIGHWLIWQEGDAAGIVQVATAEEFATLFVERPMVTQKTADGAIKVPAPIAHRQPFSPDEGTGATHPRALGDSGERTPIKFAGDEA